MGYRSEVCIALTDDAVRVLSTILEHLPASHEARNLLRDAQIQPGYLSDFQAHKDSSKDCELKLYWDYVKWYEGYECVDFVETFLQEIPHEDYRFVRVGEESDDVEERGDYYDSDVFVRRSISW